MMITVDAGRKPMGALSEAADTKKVKDIDFEALKATKDTRN